MQRSLLAKEGTTCNFASIFAISKRATFFYMPQNWDMGQIILLPIRRKACPEPARPPKPINRKTWRSSGDGIPPPALLQFIRNDTIQSLSRTARESQGMCESALRLHPGGQRPKRSSRDTWQTTWWLNTVPKLTGSRYHKIRLLELLHCQF
jgi:hypothetical protein